MENFDNNTRTRLNEHGSQLPDAMFERVMGARKKKRRAAFWWYIGPVFGLLGGLAWYGLSGSTDSDSGLAAKTTTQQTSAVTQNTTVLNTIPPSDRVGESRENVVNAMKRENAFSGKPQQTSQKQATFNHFKVSNKVSTLAFESYITSENSIKTTENNAPNSQISHIDVVAGPRPQISETQRIDNVAEIQSLMMQKLQFERKFPKLSNEVVCPTFRKKSKKHWLVEGYGGYGILQQNMKAKAAESNDFLKLRNTTERAPSSVSAGVHVGLRLSSGIVLKTGCEFQQANRIFEVKIADYELITRDPVSGAIVSSVKGERYKKTFNRSQFVQVPLLIGYERGNKNWRFGITGGITMNVFTYYKGDMLSPLSAKVPITYTDGAPGRVELYSKKPGLGVQGSLQLMRHLDHGVWLYVAPQYDMILKTISTDINPIEEKIGFMNVTMGVRKEF
jgi:hypothetical protein